MARTSLKDLLDDPDPQDQEQVDIPKPPPARAADRSEPPGAWAEDSDGESDEDAAPRETAVAEGGPKYLRLERKEVLFRPDQLDQLVLLRRRLNGRRARGEGERLTENTIVRVAVDLLLEHADNLTGVTEEELRKSVTSVLRRSGAVPM